MLTYPAAAEWRVLKVEASDLVPQQFGLSLEMVHLAKHLCALACSGATQPADEMQDLVFLAAADFLSGRE
jgi:hypothetical protein